MVKIIWMIPERELWDQYHRGNMTQSETVVESIYRFQHDREALEAPEEDDARDSEISDAYKNISVAARSK